MSSMWCRMLSSSASSLTCFSRSAPTTTQVYHVISQHASQKAVPLLERGCCYP